MFWSTVATADCVLIPKAEFTDVNVAELPQLPVTLSAGVKVSFVTSEAAHALAANTTANSAAFSRALSSIKVIRQCTVKIPSSTNTIRSSINVNPLRFLVESITLGLTDLPSSIDFRWNVQDTLVCKKFSFALELIFSF